MIELCLTLEKFEEQLWSKELNREVKELLLKLLFLKFQELNRIERASTEVRGKGNERALAEVKGALRALIEL